MYRIAIVLSIAALVACGSSDSTQSGADAGGTPAVSTPAPVEKAAAPAKPAKPAAPAAPAAPEVVVTETIGCVDLVGAGRFGEAVPVCIEELRIDPENTQVQSALAKAQASQAGGGAAAAEAAGQASSALEGAAGSLPGGLGD